MRLGVFGGSFDPVHYGHLLLAELCREACALDEVWFIPTAIAPHKPAQAAAPAAARFEMLQLATGGHEAFRTSRIELDRGGVSYTVDTLAEIQRQQPAARLFFLMGSDSLADLVTWREPERICRLATFVVVHRAGAPPPDFRPLEQLRSSQPAENASGERATADDASPPVRSHVVEMPRIELSSREIRRRRAAGLSIRFQTPRAVEEYLKSNGLYAT